MQNNKGTINDCVKQEYIRTLCSTVLINFECSVVADTLCPEYVGIGI